MQRLKVKTKVIETKLVPDGRIAAITLFGLVFTRDRRWVDRYVLNHELIHCHQQLEWLYIPFFMLYLVEWMVNIVKQFVIASGRIDLDRAYRDISFEREAYANERDFTYLSRRRHYANYRRTVVKK